MTYLIAWKKTYKTAPKLSQKQDVRIWSYNKAGKNIIAMPDCLERQLGTFELCIWRQMTGTPQGWKWRDVYRLSRHLIVLNRLMGIIEMLAVIIRDLFLTYIWSYLDRHPDSSRHAIYSKSIEKFYMNIINCILHRRASVLLVWDMATNALYMKVVCLLSISCYITNIGAR